MENTLVSDGHQVVPINNSRLLRVGHTGQNSMRYQITQRVNWYWQVTLIEHYIIKYKGKRQDYVAYNRSMILFNKSRVRSHVPWINMFK
jgi:hypothetical protein